MKFVGVALELVFDSVNTPDCAGQVCIRSGRVSGGEASLLCCSAGADRLMLQKRLGSYKICGGLVFLFAVLPTPPIRCYTAATLMYVACSWYERALSCGDASVRH